MSVPRMVDWRQSQADPYEQTPPLRSEPGALSERRVETGITDPRREPSVADLNGAAMRAAFETEYGAEPLELLHAKLAATEGEWSRGWARFGPGNVSERRVKSLLMLYAQEHRARLAEEGKKVTEAMIEEAANADPRIAAILDEIDTARAQFALLDEQRERIKERVVRGQALLRAWRVNPAGA